jgi:hypothetical protein
MAHTPASVAPVAELERRIQWRGLAVVVFVAMLAGLLVLALLPVVSPPPALEGLPGDADVFAARDLARGIAPSTDGELRFFSAFLDADAGAHPFAAGDAGRVAQSEALLRRAADRRPEELRTRVFIAHLELAQRRYQPAERVYRGVLDAHAHTPEAHIGLGVTLAMQALAESDPGHARALELQSLAQFAAVHPQDTGDDVALYDRVVMLERVGRHGEARRRAHEYLKRDATSAWAAKMQEIAAR